MLENYLELALDEVFYLVTNETPWPESLSSNQKKVSFLRELLDYYETREEYEKCTTLSEMINELEN